MLGSAASELAKLIAIATMVVALANKRSIMTFFLAFVYQTSVQLTLTDIAGNFTVSFH